MHIGDKAFDPKKFLTNLKEESEETKAKHEVKKQELMQRILHEWKQHSSYYFWEQCFKFVPYEVIQRTFDNIQELVKAGYPVQTRAGLFVATLKKLGQFPWKEGKKKEVKSDE